MPPASTKRRNQVSERAEEEDNGSSGIIRTNQTGVRKASQVEKEEEKKKCQFDVTKQVWLSSLREVSTLSFPQVASHTHTSSDFVYGKKKLGRGLHGRNSFPCQKWSGLGRTLDFVWQWSPLFNLKRFFRVLSILRLLTELTAFWLCQRKQRACI